MPSGLSIWDPARWNRLLWSAGGAMALMLVAWWQVGVAQADDRPTNLGTADRQQQPDRSKRDEAAHDNSSKQRVEQLIRQLGNPRYTARRTAANELRQIGADAFDLLHAATDDADPEIAASADYLLQEITIHWTRIDDPADARRLLAHYGDHTDDQRLRHIQALAALKEGEGTGGLCRIARFERMPLLSREAAVAVIQPREGEEPRRSIDADVIDHELGESTRPPARWLRQYRVQLRDPAESLAGWEKLIAQEQELLEQGSSDTAAAIVLGLLWNVVDVHRQLGDQAALVRTVDQMVALDPGDAEQTTVGLLQWLVDRQAWDALDAFLDKYQGRLERAKRPLYIAALGRARQGKTELAEQLAEKAAGLDAQESLESVEIARELAVREQYEWSVREYRAVIDGRPINSHEAILARVLLAIMLHDHEEYQQAVDTLEPLVKTIQKDPNVGKLYDQIQRFYERRDGDFPTREQMITRYHFYSACRYEQQQDWEQQREHLEQAIRHDRTDADVLIAMYRFHGADDAWREATRKRIVELSRLFQEEIDENPNEPNAYNQWAWLVSNTEGDFRKAIRYSHRSLELMPGTPSFLDTLGRCYYAAGDHANAVKYQREAVRLLPHLQVIHRQLALFEQALAEEGSGDGGRGPGKSE